MLIILQSLFYGFGDPISKVAYEVTPVYTLLVIRYSIAFIVLAVLFGPRIISTVRTVPLRAWLVPGICIGMACIESAYGTSKIMRNHNAFLGQKVGSGKIWRCERIHRDSTPSLSVWLGSIRHLETGLAVMARSKTKYKI